MNRLAQILRHKDQFLLDGETLIYTKDNEVIARHNDGEELVEIPMKFRKKAIGQKSREDSIEVIKEMIDSVELDGEEFIALQIALVALKE